jgi:hypothetical protein
MGNDQARGIAVDPSGAAYVIGDTDSLPSSFPIVNAYQPTFGGNRDAFVAKLAANSANLVYSTYLGGGGQEVGYAIAVNAIGQAYAMGTTASPTFPVTISTAFQPILVGSQNDFVTKLDTAGPLVYSTFVGGGGEGTSGAIAVDSSGAAYVTGTTRAGFPTTQGSFQPTFGGPPNGQDAYVFKLNPLIPGTGGLVYSTYLGGSDADLGYGIAVDSSGVAYVTGYTSSTNFPTTSGALQPSLQGIYNAFVTKLNAMGTELEYSTYLGGSGRDQGTGIALDPSVQAYVTGFTQPPSGATNNFPTTPGAYQTIPQGGYDAFIAKLNLPTLGPPAAIMVESGGTQSTTVGTQFGNPLQVKVTDANSNPLPEVTVMFAAPSAPEPRPFYRQPWPPPTPMAWRASRQLQTRS